MFLFSFEKWQPFFKWLNCHFKWPNDHSHLTMLDRGGLIPSFSSLQCCNFFMAQIGLCTFPSPTLYVLFLEIVLSLGSVISSGSKLMQAECAEGGAGLVFFCYRQIDVSLLESKASCCAGDHTARQRVVHFGVCYVPGTQSLGSYISQHRGLKCVDGCYTISFWLNCWKFFFLLHAFFPKHSPSKAECLVLFGLNIWPKFWFATNGKILHWGNSKATKDLSSLKVLWVGLIYPTLEFYNIYTFIWANHEPLCC